jgi:hypothetical protein
LWKCNLIEIYLPLLSQNGGFSSVPLGAKLPFFNFSRYITFSSRFHVHLSFAYCFASEHHPHQTTPAIARANPWDFFQFNFQLQQRRTLKAAAYWHI